MAAGTLVDDDPEAALAHARAARDRASRVAAVREAVGVAAYHAGDYAEAAREIRAYRRMSGDSGYRAVLADCERALGRPEVALRLVGEALAATPDPDEALELRLVEAGARRDLGEHAAARLVLEGALGGRPTPAILDEGDPGLLRVAAAYADLLAAEGEDPLAAEWLAAVTAAEPDDLEVEFTDLADDDADEVAPAEEADEEAVEGDAEAAAVDDDDTSELERSLVVRPGNAGADFDAEVEAEVAELLGEIDAPGEGAPGH